jgi:hypothetical protein
MAKSPITPPAQRLLRDVKHFLRRTNMPRTTFGVNAAGDGHFVARLEGGREPRHATIERVRRYLDREKANGDA